MFMFHQVHVLIPWADPKPWVCPCMKLAVVCGAAFGSSFFCLYPTDVAAQDGITQDFAEQTGGAQTDEERLVLDTIRTSVQVVDAEKNEKKRRLETGGEGAAASLADIFEGESMLRVLHSGGRLQRQTLSLRGSASQDVMLTYHGVALNTLSWASADISLIPAKLLSQAYIKPSAGSLEKGSGAIGGIIELESAFDSDALEVAASAGSMQDFALFGKRSFLFSSTAAEFALFADRTAGLYDYWDAQETHQERTHNGAWRYGAQMHLLTETSPASVDCLLYYVRFEREIAGLSEFPEAFAMATESGDMLLASLQTDLKRFQLGQSDVDASMLLTHRFTHTLYDNPKTFLGARKAHDLYIENDTRLRFTADFRYAKQFMTSLEFGYAYQRVDDEHLVLTTRKTADNDRHILSLRVEEEASFAKDKVKLDAGVRLDHVVQRDTAFSPRAVLKYAPSDWFSVHASLSYAMRFPAFDERYMHTESVRGDHDLKKQTSFLSDLTLRWDILSQAWIEISGFYHIHYDLIRFLPVTAYLYQAKNLPPSEARGLDIQAAWTLLDVLSLSLGYAWNDAFVREGHLPIPGIAEHRVTARVRLTLQDVDMWLQASYSANLAQKLSGQYARHNPFRLDAHASITLYHCLRLTLDFNNLTNDRRSEDYRQQPLPGISVMAGVNLLFR